MILPRRNPIHLYRSLLREASYLFDPTARQFYDDYIRRSFRRARTKPRDGVRHIKLVQDGWADLHNKEELKQLKRARQCLYTLERANQGYINSVKSVLKAAYSRVGVSRRIMMKKIMTPLAESDSTLPRPPTDYDEDWRPPSKFSVLLKSQKSVQKYVDRSSRKIKSFPTIPAQNRWNRPFPPSRVKGMIVDWYTRHANLLLPPLQETQWLEIYKAAMQGTKETHFKIPKRRPVGTVPVLTKAEDEIPQWSGIIDDLIRTASQKPQYTRKVRAAMGNPHHLTSRFLRRMTQQAVLGSTSTMIVDPSTGRSAVRWEPGVKPHAKASKPTESQRVSFFK